MTVLHCALHNGRFAGAAALDSARLLDVQVKARGVLEPERSLATSVETVAFSTISQARSPVVVINLHCAQTGSTSSHINLRAAALAS